MIQPVPPVGLFQVSRSRPVQGIGSTPQTPTPSPQVGTPQNPRTPDQVSVNPTHELSSTAQEARTRQIVQGLNSGQAVFGPGAALPGTPGDTSQRGQRNLQANAMGAFRTALLPSVPQIKQGFQSSNQQGNDPSGQQRGQRGGQSALMQALAPAANTPRWSQSPGIGV